MELLNYVPHMTLGILLAGLLNLFVNLYNMNRH